MRIEPYGTVWIIVRGRDSREQYFDLFVDDFKSSWTSKRAHKFPDKNAAEDALTELRRRRSLLGEEKEGRMTVEFIDIGRQKRSWKEDLSGASEPDEPKGHYPGGCYPTCKQAAAVKRASMDLTRALAELRRA